MGFNTLRYEATPDGGVIAGMGGGEGEFSQGVEQPAAAPAEPNYAEQIAELQATIEQQQAALEQFAPVAQMFQPQQQAPQTPEFPIPDPFSDNYGQSFQQAVNQAVQQAISPYQEMMAEQQFESLKADARELVADVEHRNGELLRPAYEEGQQGIDPAQQVVDLAVELYPQFAARFGESIRSEEMAIEQAYNRVKSYQQALIAADDARRTNQMRALSDAPSAPGSSGISAEPAVTTQPGGWAAFRVKQGLV